MMNVFVTNLGKYNEGELIGEWVELPVSEEDLKKVFQRIGISNEPDESGNYYEEYFITDYECDFYNVGEYESIDTLNEIAEQLEELDEEQQDVVKAMISECGYLTNVPDNVARYFDYEAFGRDLRLEGTFIFTDNGACVEVMQ